MSTSRAQHNHERRSWPPFPQRLRTARTIRGMTHHRLGRLAGFAPQALQSYEAGELVPLLDCGCRLARALDVPAAWLLFGVLPHTAGWLVDASVDGFALRLRVLRQVRRMTHEAVAQLVGAATGRIIKYEAAELSPPIVMVQELARALAVPVELLGLWTYPSEEPPYMPPELEDVVRVCL